ncbi:MAG: hypothetical protein ABI091_12650 [Ferruginibacter sp.]
MNKTFLTLLLGIGIGILLAPAKGSDTWRSIVDGFDDYMDKAEEEGEDVLEQGEKLLKKKSRV